MRKQLQDLMLGMIQVKPLNQEKLKSITKFTHRIVYTWKLMWDWPDCDLVNRYPSSVRILTYLLTNTYN